MPHRIKCPTFLPLTKASGTPMTRAAIRLASGQKVPFIIMCGSQNSASLGIAAGLPKWRSRPWFFLAHSCAPELLKCFGMN